MRVVFMGTPEFAVPTLRELVRSGHEMIAAYTRAPQPAGRRGLELKKTPIHYAAELLSIPVHTPPTLRNQEAQDIFRSHAADVVVVVAYGLLLPIPVLQAPMAGCLNLHASILPRWRGAAPIQRAVMAGDAETGVDLMRMEAGLDTGPVALREAIPIRPEDTAGDLANRLAQIAAGLAVRGLSALERGSLEFREQSDAGVCYAKKISKTEAEIDWNCDADQVRNQIHGLSPNPGAYSLVSFGQRLERCKILRVQAVAANGAPGAILDGEMTVACARGAVRVIEGQRAGRAVMRGEDIIRGEKALAGGAFRRAGSSSSARPAQS